MDEVLGEIARVLREELGLSREPRPSDDLVVDLQLDSVGALKEEDAAAVRTIADLAALVLRRREEARAC